MGTNLMAANLKGRVHDCRVPDCHVPDCHEHDDSAVKVGMYNVDGRRRTGLPETPASN